MAARKKTSGGMEFQTEGECKALNETLPRAKQFLQCLFCHLYFRRRYLKEHINGHAGIRWKCTEDEICTVSFGSKDALRKHIIRVHHPPRYFCSKCALATNYRMCLKRHLINVHQVNEEDVIKFIPKTTVKKKKKKNKKNKK